MVLRVGHRGAPLVAPPNTMASFRAALDLGCDWVECDCRPTLDGEIVLSHDPHVTDTLGHVHHVSESLSSDLAALDLGGGEGVPTLRDLVAFASGRCGVMADIKCDSWERQIGEILAPLSPSHKLAPGAGPDGRRRFRLYHPDLPISLSVGAQDEALLEAEWDGLDTDAVTLQHPLVTRARIEDLHARGIRVFAWTVDVLETLRRLAAWGIDGLISNRADLLGRL